VAARTLISAQTTEAFWNAVKHMKPLSGGGSHCSLGPDLMYPFLSELSEKADRGDLSAIPECRPCLIRFRKPGFDLGPPGHGPFSR